jgi:hypothetical protein
MKGWFMAASEKRLRAVATIVGSLKTAYPDAKKLSINIDFEWKEADQTYDVELCPVVKIEIER